MQPYMPGYQYQPQYPQPYQDRLAQLQNQYQQTIPQQQMQPMQQQVPQTNQGLLWVQGEAAARSYLVAPNSTVLLMDSDASRFYLKSADNAGMPSLRTFEYAEITGNTAQPVQNVPENLDAKYVTREEYNNLQARYAEIMDKLNSFPASVVPDEPIKKSTARGNTGRTKGGTDNGKSTI